MGMFIMSLKNTAFSIKQVSFAIYRSASTDIFNKATIGSYQQVHTQIWIMKRTVHGFQNLGSLDEHLVQWLSGHLGHLCCIFKCLAHLCFQCSCQLRSAPEEATSASSGAFVPTTHVGDLDEVQGFWLQITPALAMLSIWEWGSAWKFCLLSNQNINNFQKMYSLKTFNLIFCVLSEAPTHGLHV